MIFLQVALTLLFPALVVWAEPRSRLVRTASPVLLCYAFGMLLGNQGLLTFDSGAALTESEIAVALAIPLLLFSVDLGAWLRLARSTVLSFGLVMLSGMAASAGAHLLLRSRLDDTARMAGMLTGVYIGGTPNMAAIGTGLGVPSQTFILLNAADMVVSMIYLLFLFTLARRVLGWFLPNRTGRERLDDDEPVRAVRGLPPWRSLGLGLGLAIACVGLTLLLGRSFPENGRGALMILALTTMGLGLSFVPRVRAMEHSQDMGQFLLLVFCVAMGITTDFHELFSASPLVVLFCGLVVGGAFVMHVFLSALFRIDRDTVIITSAAGIFGPHMVGPVAAAIGNREVLFSGIASGLVGYAAGNYLGMGLAWMLM